MIYSYGELDDRQIDLLCEIGNIGAGNAATSLSVMIDECVRINVSRVRILDTDGIISLIGGPEDMSVAITIRFDGDLRGAVMFLLSYEDAHKIAGLLITNTGKQGDAEGLSEMKISAIKEVGNILGSSYLGAISTLTGFRFNISIPYVSVDMTGAIMNVPMTEFSIDRSRILFIEESLSTDTHNLKGHVIMFPDEQSINKIIMELGNNIYEI